MLRDRVRASDPAEATFVHWGATSQDVSDTALVLCLTRARSVLTTDHDRLASALRQLSDQHAGTVMLARTLLQPAPPTTFGLKAAGWFGAVSRCGQRMAEAFEEACVLQFGGASGTLAALGTHGPAVAAELARALALPNPGAPWHAHRDRLAALVAACGIYTGALGKIARDVALLMQDEVAEAAEPGGSSSTMPHKRNPAGCAVALAAATRVPGLVSAFLSGLPQEHERGVGGWHAETATVSAVVQATGSALAAMAEVMEHLEVDPERMRANIAATGGVVFAERAMMLLAPALGRDAASRVIAGAIEAARRGPGGFVAALRANPDVQAALAPSDLSTLTTPEAYLGAAEQFRRQLIDTERE
jgi:3-carboxy-cis,cis-muconate cycloisomerase